MKKLLTFLLLFSTAYAQTYITPHLDTVNVVLKQGTPSSFVTTPTSATYTPNGPASNAVTVKGYSGGVVPPVKPISAPGYPATGTFTNSVVITGKSNTTISGLKINGGKTPCITLSNCQNVHITACYLLNSTSSNGAIWLYNCSGITIDYNVFDNVATGVYAQACTAGTVSVNYNRFHNMQGPLPRGQWVQFNNVSGPGLSVSYNRGDNVAGASNPEDCINMFQANGTPASPIQIVGNWAYGGGPSTSGSFIALGDNGGSYQYAANNIGVNTGQAGIFIAGGDHNTITGNSLYAIKQPFTNIAVYVWGQSGYAVTNGSVTNNMATWYNGIDPKLNGGLNGYWDEGSGTVNQASNVNNNWNAGLTAAILPPVNTW